MPDGTGARSRPAVRAALGAACTSPMAIMVTLAALFFAVVDAGMQFGVTQILKLASAG